ncbi:MAG: nucleotide-binding protein [Anaerolineae bacterium]|nr:nucleotide-binding protein [Anaerolineae bacterium]
MDLQQPYYFVSYARADIDRVREFVSRLNELGIRTWIDVDALAPGENWQHSIQQGLARAAGLIVFLSRNSVDSSWVHSELSAILDRSAAVFPILLDDLPPDAIPVSLQTVYYLDVRDWSRVGEQVAQLATTIKRSEAARIPTHTGLHDTEIVQIATESADAARGGGTPSSTAAAPPDSVFVVHGRDQQFLADVETYLQSINVTPVVLSKMSNANQTSLFQKLLFYAGNTYFAVVLISSDDLGGLDAEFQQYGNRALEYRARQNVVLELGYFYGKLGWDRVFVLYKPATQSIPRFERPSDLNGVLFDDYDATGNWKTILHTKLKNAGFVVP